MAVASNVEILETSEIQQVEKDGKAFDEKLRNFIISHSIGQCMAAAKTMLIKPDLRNLLAQKLITKYPCGMGSSIVILRV